MRIRLFGRLRDAPGPAEMTVDPPADVADSNQLRLWLGRDRPALLDPSIRMALDNRIVTDAEPIAAVAEIAFLPPVSGG